MRNRILYCLVPVVLIGAICSPAITVQTRTGFTCTLCRAQRVDYSLFGYSWQTFVDTKFAKWYSQHRPEHDHAWVHAGCQRGSNIFGVATEFSCYRLHPVCDITPDLELEFAERADRETLNAFFNNLQSDDRKAQEGAIAKAWSWHGISYSTNE